MYMKIIITEDQLKGLLGGKKITLYHGTDIEHKFNQAGDFQNGSFFSTEQYFAETWGKFIYEVQISPELNLFNSWNPTHVQELLDNVKDIKNPFAVEEEETEVSEVSQIVKNPDNWIIFEDNPQVIPWISSRYDGVWVWEDVENLLLFSPVDSKVIGSKLIKSDNVYDRVKS